jgi:hypothetical protein
VAKKIILCLGAWTGLFLQKSYVNGPLQLQLNSLCFFDLVSDILTVIQTSYGFWQVPERHRDEYQIGKLPLWIHWGRYFDFLHPEDALHVQQYSNEQDLAYFGKLIETCVLIVARISHL